MSSDTDNRLLDQIYEAAVFPETWTSTLHEIANAAGCAGGTILVRRSTDWIGWRFSEGTARQSELVSLLSGIPQLNSGEPP